MVSVGGLLVNIVGLVFFHEHAHAAHSHGEETEKTDDIEQGHINGEKCSHYHNHVGHHENMYGVYLHVLADALGSVAVIVSSILIKFFGLYIADPICCFAISTLILLAAIPFIIKTA